MSVKETLKQLESEKTKVLMAELYGAEKAEENRARYRYVAEHFEKTYGERDIKLFTSPGRTEISGNHTDHEGGRSQSWQGAGGQHQPGLRRSGGTERNRHDPHFK